MNREYIWEGDSAARGCLLALSRLVSDFLVFFHVGGVDRKV